MARSRGIEPSTASCPRLSPRTPGLPSAPPCYVPQRPGRHAHACTLRDGAKPQSSPHRSVDQWAHAEDGAMGRPSGRRGALQLCLENTPVPTEHQCTPRRLPRQPDTAPPWEQPPAPHGQEYADSWGSNTHHPLTGTGQGLREPPPQNRRGRARERLPRTEGAHPSRGTQDQQAHTPRQEAPRS